jgi:hypothetical protein
VAVSTVSGREPVAPGIVFEPDWGPEPGVAPVADPASSITMAAVARKA